MSGFDTAAINCDLGAAWTEGSNAFALEPVNIEIGNVLKASAHAALGRVSREVFSPDQPQQMMAKAAEIEAGPIEISLHDIGGVDLAVALYARAQNVSRDAARQAIIDTIRASSADVVKDNANAAAAVEALIRFITTPGQTLNIKLTPVAKAPALQLVQLLKTDPSLALAQFRIEASTGL
jgi:hypothetical protein